VPRSKRWAGLAVVATPIGNLADITARAVTMLEEADVIACEDTRTTAKLLRAHGIGSPLTPYHEHNAERARPALLARLMRGERVALVSDAGTPLISDPGYKLVRAAIAQGVPVTTAPGPSAPLAALAVSGLPTDRFLFAGFLPPRPGRRKSALADIAAMRVSLIFFESSRRLAASLADMAEVLGPREAAVCRELTKLHEEVRRGTLAVLAAQYGAEGPPKGEVVVVVGPPAAPAATDQDEIDRLLGQALEGESLRDAVDAVAAATGAPRKTVYARALARREGGKDGA
jgi:16S rRNA (cytidine1402-2'-O)-methyltransferase